MQKWSQPFWMQVLHRDLSKSDFKIELGRSFQAPFARKGTHMNVNKSDLLKSAKQAESSARELLDKVASLNTEVGASLQGAKRLESKVIAKEREEAEARERLRQEEKRRQFFDSEEQHGVFVSDRDMPGSDDKPAETVQTRVHDAVEAPSEEKETAIKPTKEESEKVKTTEKQAEKPVTEEKDSEKKVETALLSRKEEGSEKRIEAEEIPVNENVSEDTENREQGSKSVADENGAEQHEQESKQQTNSDTEEMAENVIQEKNDRQNSTGRQPGGDRQNRSDRTDRRVRDDRRTGRDNRRVALPIPAVRTEREPHRDPMASGMIPEAKTESTDLDATSGQATVRGATTVVPAPRVLTGQTTVATDPHIHVPERGVTIGMDRNADPLTAADLWATDRQEARIMQARTKIRMRRMYAAEGISSAAARQSVHRHQSLP